MLFTLALTTLQSLKCTRMGKLIVVIPAKERHPVPRYGAGIHPVQPVQTWRHHG